MTEMLLKIICIFLLILAGFTSVYGQTIKCTDANKKRCQWDAYFLATAPQYRKGSNKELNLRIVNTPAMDVGFHVAYGGLHAMVFIGNLIETNDSDWFWGMRFEEEKRFFSKTLQLSTIHKNTFVLDGTPGACTLNDTGHEAIMKFCALHENKYDMNNSSTSYGEIHEITNGPNGTGERIGFSVQDDIRFGEFGLDLMVKYIRLEVMNGRAAFEPNYWDSKHYFMDGRLSLARKHLNDDPKLSSFEKTLEAIGEGKLTPMQLLVYQHRMSQFSPISIQLFNGRCTEDFAFCWYQKNAIGGKLHFGQLSPSCSYWRMVEKPDNLSWGVKLSKFTVFTQDDYSQLILHDQRAVIDTTTENIIVPDSQWILVKKMLKISKCDRCANLTNGAFDYNSECGDQLAKNPTIFLHIEDHLYKIPPTHYINMRKFVGNTDPTNCSQALQIVKNSNKFDPLWHLGLPFLHTSCVAMSYEREDRREDRRFLVKEQMWLSGGIPFINNGISDRVLQSKTLLIWLTFMICVLQMKCF